MNRHILFLTALIGSGLIVFGQARGGNWPTYGGDAQRSGWQGGETSITKDTVKNLQLLWKIKLQTQARGMRPVMPPVIQGRLISYRGFKELAFVATNADIVYAIDADLGTIFWQKHLEYSTREPQVMTSSWACPGGLTAMPTMAPPGRGGAVGRGAPAPAGAANRGSAFIGGPPGVYALSSDGRLHRLNTSTGDDMTQPVSVIPANARASSLNMADNVIYTVTSHGCNGDPNALWAIDLGVDPLKVRSFALNGRSGREFGGPVIGSDGTVYVQTSSDNLFALSPRELQLKQSAPPEKRGDSVPSTDSAFKFASPAVFSYNNRDLTAAACAVQRLCLLDAAALTSLYQTAQIAQTARNASSVWERGIWGSISSWQDMDGTRWILAPVLGPPHSDLKALIANGPVTDGFIAAFKVEEKSGKVELTPAWISRDLESPLPPVVANGIVFAVSAGEFTRQLRDPGDVTSVDERPKGSTHATLYALDAVTGKELYSSRNSVTVPASLTGLTVANGRVYFSGIDGTVYAFGMYLEH